MVRDLNALKRRVQTLESQVAELVERVSAYESGTVNNPNKAIYVSDGKDGAVAKVDFDASLGALRATKVR